MAVMGVVSVLAVLLVRWRPEVFAQLGAMPFTLIVPIAMEEKLRFAIREGGRTVGAGVVAQVMD